MSSMVVGDVWNLFSIGCRGDRYGQLCFGSLQLQRHLCWFWTNVLFGFNTN